MQGLDGDDTLISRIVSAAVMTALFLVVFRFESHAQWESANGDYSDPIVALAASGSSLLASSLNDGLFRSTDDGQNWTKLGFGLPSGPRVVGLTMSGNTIIACTDDGYFGMYRSTDLGLTWSATYLIGHTISIVNGMALVSTGRGGVYKSTNDGFTWVETGTGLPIYGASFVGIGAVVFAASEMGVYRSTDNGSTWVGVNTGLPSAYVECIAVKESQLFVGTDGGGVFLSTNNGDSWSAVNNGLAAVGTGLPYQIVNALIVIDTAIFAGTVIDGVFRSTDNGASWTPMNSGLENGNIQAFVRKGDSLYAGGNDGEIYVTSNYGSTWMLAHTGMGSRDVSSIVYRNNALIAGTSLGFPSGIYRSANLGMSWSRNTVGLPDTDFSCFYSSDKSLLVGTNGAGIYASTDNGYVWAPTGLTTGAVSGFSTHAGYLFAATSAGVYRSTDDGMTWNSADSGLTQTSVTSLCSLDSQLFAGTPGGVFVSTDAGSSWVAANTGLWNAGVRSLASNGSNLFAGTSTGVFVSPNYGKTWNVSAFQCCFVYGLSVIGHTLFAGTPSRIGGGGGVCISTDNGLSWVDYNRGLGGDGKSFAAAGNYVFVGALFRGLYRIPLSQVVSVSELISRAPQAFALDQNYPNPFNPSTTIKFELPRTSKVSLGVYDILGREVCVLVNEEREAGAYEAKFDGTNLASGVYFYRIQAGSFVQTKKLLLLH